MDWNGKDPKDSDTAPRLKFPDGRNAAFVPAYEHTKQEMDANAERLARCWNCHDELVKALKDVLRTFVTKEAYPAFVDDGDNSRFCDMATVETFARAEVEKADANKQNMTSQLQGDDCRVDHCVDSAGR